MKRIIAITGASGYLGRHLIAFLHSIMNDSIREFVAIDIQKVEYPNEIPVTCYIQDVRDDFSGILHNHEVTDLIHMAWTLNPTHNVHHAYSVDLEGTRNALTMALQTGVTYFLHTSSTLAYGAYKDNPYPLFESHPLRGNCNFHYPYHKALAEELIDRFEKNHPELIIGRIRPSAILSYELNNYITEILRGGWRTFFLMPYPEKNTPIQFLHLSDALKGFQIVIKKRLPGIFNLTPNSDYKVGDIPLLLNGRGIKLPYQILRTLLWIQWKLRISQAPPGYMDFVAYPFVASNQKLRKEGFNPLFTTKDTLLTLKYGDPEK
ncbi:NAD-dependent epimerase/dehydratase family protein [Candidatus Hodarchaeum mangrovi]